MLEQEYKSLCSLSQSPMIRHNTDSVLENVPINPDVCRNAMDTEKLSGDSKIIIEGSEAMKNLTSEFKSCQNVINNSDVHAVDRSVDTRNKDEFLVTSSIGNTNKPSGDTSVGTPEKEENLINYLTESAKKPSVDTTIDTSTKKSGGGGGSLS